MILYKYWRYIKRKCNPIIDLLKFTFIKNVLSGLVPLIYIQVYCQALFLLKKKSKGKKFVLLEYLEKLLEYDFRPILSKYDAMSVRE